MTLGLAVGPRLNAPGRLGDPKPVVELLLSSDDQQIQDQVQRIEQVKQ